MWKNNKRNPSGLQQRRYRAGWMMLGSMTLLVGSSSSFAPPHPTASPSSIPYQQLPRRYCNTAYTHQQRCLNYAKQKMVGSPNEDSTSTMDKALRWIVFSDVGSLVLGSVGLVALLVGRLLLDSNDNNGLPDPAETRENLLSAMAIGGVLLNGLTQLDVESVKATPVQLDGILVEVDGDDEYAWVLRSVVSSLESVSSAVLLERDEVAHQWTVVSRHGVVPTTTTSVTSNNNTPLLDKAATIVGKEEDGGETTTSLPNLQALPGWKQELLINGKFLPSNTPATLLVPVPQGRYGRLLVMGSDRSRSFTPKDIAWCRAAAGRL